MAIDFSGVQSLRVGGPVGVAGLEQDTDPVVIEMRARQYVRSIMTTADQTGTKTAWVVDQLTTNLGADDARDAAIVGLAWCSVGLMAVVSLIAGWAVAAV